MYRSVKVFSIFASGTLLGTSTASLTTSSGFPLFSSTPVNELKQQSYISSLQDNVIGISRFCSCAMTVIAVAADYKITLFGKDRTSNNYAELKSKIHERSAIRLRKMCCRNGGVFVKVAQHLGSLEYLLPSEYVNVMRVLHSTAPSSPMNDVRQVIEDELGHPLEQLFNEFNEVPCGAASLAQAHKAKLKESEGTVVVKVQHKNVKKFAYLDMRTMEFLFNVAEKLFPEFRLRWLLETTKANLPLELDFLHEADNCELADKTYQTMQRFVKFPKIYREFSTTRVLTMEFCEGCHVDNLAFMKANGIDAKKVVSLLGKLYSDMIFTKGLMHCDPHPGNILVNKDPKSGEVNLALLDHGLYQQLSEQFRLDYCRLWLGLISGDVEAIRLAAERMGTPDSAEMFACVVAGRSWESVVHGDVAVTKKTSEEDEVIQTRAVKLVPELTLMLDNVPRQLLLILKTNDLIRSIQSKLKCPSDLSAFLAQTRACFWALASSDMRRCWSRWSQPGGNYISKVNNVISASWCSLLVTASLLFRLFQTKIAEYSLAFTSFLDEKEIITKAHPQRVLKKITR